MENMSGKFFFIIINLRAHGKTITVQIETKQ